MAFVSGCQLNWLPNSLVNWSEYETLCNIGLNSSSHLLACSSLYLKKKKKKEKKVITESSHWPINKNGFLWPFPRIIKKIKKLCRLLDFCNFVFIVCGLMYEMEEKSHHFLDSWYTFRHADWQVISSAPSNILVLWIYSSLSLMLSGKDLKLLHF